MSGTERQIQRFEARERQTREDLSAKRDRNVVRQGQMETGPVNVWKPVTGLAKHALTHTAVQLNTRQGQLCQTPRRDERGKSIGRQAPRELAPLAASGTPAQLLLSSWDLLGIRILITDSVRLIKAD